MNLIEVKNKSKSDPNKKPYTTVVDSTGRLGCDCRGWTVLKPGKPRECTHLTGKDGLVVTYKLTTESRGDYLYATNLRTMGDVQRAENNAAQATPVPTKSKPKPKAKPGVPVVPMKPAVVAHGIKIIDIDEPDAYVDPMLASLMPDIPNQKVATVLKALLKYAARDWALEEKFDGHRVIVAVMDGGVVKAWSRPKAGADAIVRELPPHILEAFKSFPTGTYDGELIMPGGISTDVTNLEYQDKLVFVVFDVLRLLGQDTTGNTYDERREYLTEIFSVERADNYGEFVTLAESVAPSVAYVQAIFDRKGEGAILKRRKARYQPGARSADFIKIKGLETCPMIVAGFKKGKLGPYATVILENPVDGTKVPVKTKDNAMLAAFAKNPDSFIGRMMLLEYQFRTKDGGYRHPRWDRWENE